MRGVGVLVRFVKTSSGMAITAFGRRAVRRSYSHTHAAPLRFSQVVVGFVTCFQWAPTWSSPYSVWGRAPVSAADPEGPFT